MKSYVYLLECISDWDTSYKIGYTKNRNVNKRILGLQTGNKDLIRCIDIFETHHGRKVELAMHNFYKYKNKRGEWFNLDLEEVMSFKKICQKIENSLNIIYNSEMN